MKTRKFLSLLLVLAMVLSFAATSAFATTIGAVSIASGEPIQIDWTQTSANNFTGVVQSTENPSATVFRVPATFLLWAESDYTVSASGGATVNYEYSSPDGSNKAYTVNVTAAGSNARLTATNGTATYAANLPAATTYAGGGTKPTSVVSYLPIGQYATGSGWGSSAGKFTTGTGYASTGVSLGAFGGYIEFYFADAIQNNATNPYGVDFVVYGNAFNGNPEAGAVQVSADGSVWYELAGSHYYDGNFAPTNVTQSNGKFANAYTGTLRNADVTYTLNSSNIHATMTDGVSSITASPFTNATAWWPTTAEGYPAGTPHTDNNVTVSHSNTALTFGGVTAIPDSNTTAYYGFGYADVTPNGSPAHYGDAVNPYTPYTSSKTGGDGFDLSWAVDIATGLPVDLSNTPIHYVRVYSAVLDNATFGETSTEVCGIFTINGTGSGAATTDLIVAKPGAGVITTANGQSQDVTPGIYMIRSSEENVFLNGVKVTASSGYSFTIESGKCYQIITQNGSESPYVTVLRAS